MNRAAWLLPLVLTGCSMRTFVVRRTAGVLDKGLASIDREPDVDLAADALPAQLKTIEVFLESDPKNVQLLDLCAQGYAGYALLFLEDTDPTRARELYLRARDFGLRSLEAQGKGAAVRSRFWTALAWASWINLSKDNPDALAGLPKAVELMTQVAERDPKYYHGGPDLFLGMYWGRPKVFGGDPAKAKAHFERAVAASDGRFLMTLVKYARVYAVGVQDRELFHRLLEKVVDAPADALPAARLANEVARVQAKNLIEQADELFE